MFPGTVVLARITNGREDPLTRGKWRPAVFADWASADGSCRLWGLTTKSTFATGVPRDPATGLELVGLDPGYLWGPRIAHVPEWDVEGVIWAAPLELLVACVTQSGSHGRSYSVEWAERTHREHVEAGWYWPKR